NSNKLEISSEIKNLTLSDLKIIIDNYNNSTGNLALNISNSGSRDIIGFILKIIDNESNIWKEDIIDYILLNETKSKNYKLPSNLSKIIVFVDYYNNIEESNESNNFDYWPKSKEPIKLENISVEINNSDNSNKSKNWNKNKLKEKIKSKIKSKFEKGEYKEKYDKKHSNNNNNDDNSQNNKSKESSNKIKTKNLESIWNNCFYDNFSVLSQKYFNERKNLFEKEKNHYTTKAKITSQNKTKKIKN
ncbi:MAG: hypothetical protein KC550_05785, partial [Nanoarchaeota archaeon]|nr:hypothetical protein [Nanoarchaeota archaeon]